MTPYAYKFRLCPNEVQQQLIKKTFGCTRFVFNYFLELRNKEYTEAKISSSYYKDTKKLPALKAELPWLKEVDSVALQATLNNLQTAFVNFFEKRTNKPKFKSKHTSKQSYTTKFSHKNIQIVKEGIKLPKLGVVAAVIHRHVDGRIISATVSKTSSEKYFCSVLVDRSIPQLPKIDSTIGLDLGLIDLVAFSDGKKEPNPKHLRKAEKSLKREQKRFSRKKKGSKNREKSRIKLARKYERITNARKDHLHKLSTNIVKSHDIVCTESLAVKNMVKNHKLAKSISDACWTTLTTMVNYKAEMYGKQHIKIDRFFASSKTCSCCGYKMESMGLNIREWTCPQCGAVHDRDINAAKNVKNEGLRLLNSTVGHTGINACGDCVSNSGAKRRSYSGSLKQEKEVILDIMKPLPQNFGTTGI